jgi:hypothetical protein
LTAIFGAPLCKHAFASPIVTPFDPLLVRWPKTTPSLRTVIMSGRNSWRQSEGSSVLSWTKIIWDPAILLYGSSDSVGYLKRHI